MLATQCLVVAAIAGLANAHGISTSPKPRQAGAAMKAACGQQVYNNQASDDAGNIQGMLQVAASQTDYNAAACNIWQCKGYKAADNTANVQTFTSGQNVPMTFDVRAPHTGKANVSVVDTASNSVIGQPLISWDVFASTSTPIPANDTSFSVTIPDLGGKCTTVGECVIQHFWNAESINQTYESCIDFTVGGSGSAVGSGGNSSASGAATVTSAAAVTISSAKAVPTTLATSVVAKVATSSVAPSASTSAGDAGADESCNA